MCGCREPVLECYYVIIGNGKSSLIIVVKSGDEDIFRKNKKKPQIEYDKENQQPIIRCSICTGEQVAGFRNRQTGKFEEIMLIKSEMDLKRFKEMYGVDEIRKEY